MTNSKWHEYVIVHSNSNKKHENAKSMEDSIKNLRIVITEFELEKDLVKKNLLKLIIIEKLSNLLFYTTKLTSLLDFKLTELMTFQRIINEQNKIIKK